MLLDVKITLIYKSFKVNSCFNFQAEIMHTPAGFVLKRCYKKKVFTSTDRGVLVKFEIGRRPCRAGARAVDYGGPSVYQERPKFEIKHKNCCLQKSKLVNWGGPRISIGGARPPWSQPWGLYNAKNFIILCQMFVNFFSYVPFGVRYFCPRHTTSAV